jgi:acetyltransferase-like isoleucine patch superfamily enzyme
MSQKILRKDRSKVRKEGKEAWLLGPLLFRLYGLTKGVRIRNYIRDKVLSLEGGGHYSRTIRRIFSVYHDIEIGMYTNGPCYSLRQLPPGTKIGRYSGTYPTARAFSGNHPMDRKSTHAFFFNPELGYARKESDIERTQLTIGNDVCLYHNSVILPSVRRIGDGAVIGAGAIVTKDVPDFAIVVGNPAKIVKYRFSEEMRRKIKESKWWDKDMRELQEYMEEFAHPLESDENQKNQVR